MDITQQQTSSSDTALPPQLEPSHRHDVSAGHHALRNAVGNDSELTKADLQRFVISMRERGLTAGG